MQWTMARIRGRSRPSLFWSGFAKPPSCHAGRLIGMAIIRPEIRKDPREPSSTGDPHIPKFNAAARYSPTPSRVQYHRRDQ
ncbi:hypothetical protein, partial [Bifidobacterium catenulatum]|uniref:hypothetical protein n=3 Tax=Bifidobacterium catenulatum TaxID=1686 RepID=UPI0024817C50